MDGIHDLGGKEGFGPVEPEQNEPVFHERWEAAVYTMNRRLGAAGVVKNTDQFRHAIERIDPRAYLTHGYYGRWLGGLENLLVEGGHLDQEALDARVLALGGDPADLVAARPNPEPDRVTAPEARGAGRALTVQPLFSAGQQVCTRDHPVSGHTRLPAYARGCVGTVVAFYGGWVLPDTNAHGLGEQPEPLYNVRFSGEALWGTEAEPGQSVHLDLFESYLEACND